VAGRTGHDYNNQFVGNELVWFGKNRSKIETASIQSLISPIGKVYIFTRTSNKDPFMYAGIGKAKSVEDTSPVKIVWEYVDENEFSPVVLPEEVLKVQKYREGVTKQISVNVYERNPEARRKCIEHYGTSCCVCQFEFLKFYGQIGEDFIHVHHLKPLSEIGQDYELEPIEDLRPVCPNCHAMLHRKKPPYTIEELRYIIQKTKTFIYSS
jgi:predicted HNH restriction endonuclease